MPAEIQVAVVGAGQAGLSVSRELTLLGVEHVVLERGRPGDSWRSRWDSFCLNTPRWTVSLPGRPYEGPDPQGFHSREEIAASMEDYAAWIAAPLRLGVEVSGLEAAPAGFLLRTSDGDVRARQVVVASGAFQKPHHPVPPSAFPSRLAVIDAQQYRRPTDLPPGRVLVVGSGQTGCQIAEDLHLAGREVVVACGRAPWSPRRLEGLDVIDWLARTSWFEHPLSSLPNPRFRLLGNVLVSGFAGGHDLNHRVMQKMGIQLAGHLTGVEGGRARFASDLAETVAFSDQLYEAQCRILRDELPAAGYQVPRMPEPEPFAAGAAEEVDLASLGSVVFTSGYRPDYGWIRLPAFDAMGYPVTEDGASTAAPGLFFCGVHFMRKRKSALLFGVGEDAEVVARRVAARA